MKCTLCDLFWSKMWARSEAWERAQSNQHHLWSQESAFNRSLIEQGRAIENDDPASALELYRQAAEDGSVWAMEMMAWHLATGTAAPANFSEAQSHYRRAIAGGSWMATLGYADLLERHGYQQECDNLLEDGIAAGFAPSHFWLARYRHARSPTAKTRHMVRPLLEHAALCGHPMAQMMVSRWKLLGKLGIGNVPSGLVAAARLAIAIARHDAVHEPVASKQSSG